MQDVWSMINYKFVSCVFTLRTYEWPTATFLLDKSLTLAGLQQSLDPMLHDQGDRDDSFRQDLKIYISNLQFLETFN